MEIRHIALPGVLIIEPQAHLDSRGFFYESFNQRKFRSLTGAPTEFVQDNHSRSSQYVLRGLHYQIRQAQGKLVRVVAGEIFDVAVDIRKSSPAFGQWTGLVLSSENRRQLWIPPGFAMGLLSSVLPRSCFTRRRTTGLQNTSAPLRGMTHPSESSGRSIGRRYYRQRTSWAAHYGKARYLHEDPSDG